jgi:hypothetical protein
MRPHAFGTMKTGARVEDSRRLKAACALKGSKRLFCALVGRVGSGCATVGRVGSGAALDQAAPRLAALDRGPRWIRLRHGWPRWIGGRVCLAKTWRPAASPPPQSSEDARYSVTFPWWGGGIDSRLGTREEAFAAQGGGQASFFSVGSDEEGGRGPLGGIGVRGPSLLAYSKNGFLGLPTPIADFLNRLLL